MIKKWWQGPWWRILFTLQFWFLIILVGSPILILLNLISGQMIFVIAHALFWIATGICFIFWLIWTKSVERKILRYSFALLTILIWLVGGSAIPLLITNSIGWVLAIISLMIGGGAFYGANILFKAVKTKQLIDSAIPLISQIIQQFGRDKK